MDEEVLMMLIELEEKSWQANINEDAAYFLGATTEDMFVVAPFGIFDRQAIVQQIESKQGASYKSVNIDAPHVMLLSKESALISYEATIEAAYQDKDMTIQRYVTAVYVRQNGAWKTAFSQHTDMK
jgi:hypothetical protein